MAYNLLCSEGSYVYNETSRTKSCDFSKGSWHTNIVIRNSIQLDQDFVME